MGSVKNVVVLDYGSGNLRSAERALRRCDAMCWASVNGGDVALFDRQAALAAQMCEFCVFAGLLDDE